MPKRFHDWCFSPIWIVTLLDILDDSHKSSMHLFSFLYWSNDKSSFKSLSKTLGFYAKMDLDSPKNSKSPNPQWETNEKGSRIRIIPSFVNIHFVSLPLCTVLYVDIVSTYIICYTPISYAHASLSFCILLHVLISLYYLLLVCLLLWYKLFLDG